MQPDPGLTIRLGAVRDTHIAGRCWAWWRCRSNRAPLAAVGSQSEGGSCPQAALPLPLLDSFKDSVFGLLFATNSNGLPCVHPTNWNTCPTNWNTWGASTRLIGTPYPD